MNRRRNLKNNAELPSRRSPQRTCAGCRKVLDQDLLVRYVLSPEQQVLVDYRHKLPGRGIYTCIHLACLQAAIKQGRFIRGLRADALRPEPEALWKMLARQIEERVLSLIGMARKSGQSSSGLRQIKAEAARERLPALMVLALDLSTGTREKLQQFAARNEIPCYIAFNKAVLGQVLGKAERGAVAIGAGPLATAIIEELERFKSISGES